MIAAAPFLALTLALLPPQAATSSGNWVVVSVNRVIAPDQHPGECFVQARVEQVVRGEAYRVGDAIAISLACRLGGMTPTAARRGSEMLTIETLRSLKRALVHVDAGGRVLENDYYGLGGYTPASPDPL